MLKLISIFSVVVSLNI